MPTLPAEKAGANRTAAATRANATSGSGNRGGKREVTLAVLGESSAVGFPFQDWLNAGEIVAWQLRQALPGQTFHTELVAVPGHTLEQQHKKLLSLREIPDVLIIYCGHNEFAAPTPSGREVNHYLDTQTQSRFAIVGDVLARESPLCRLFQETTDQYRVHQVPLRDKKRPLVDVPSYTPAEYAARLANFARRLEAIVVRCERTGTLPVLVIPPANDGGYEPNRSFLAPGTPRAEREAFAAAFLSAREAESHDRAGSEAKYRALLDRQPGFAEAHFRLARLLEQGGSWDEAHTHYVQARDLDGHPVRCLTAFQDVYREVAARHGCILVDGQALFRKAGMHRLLDDHLFNDAMHPSLRGHIALAQGVLDALHARGALGLPADTPPPRIDPAASALHFGLNPAAWVTVCERAVMFYVAMAAQRYDPSERLGKCALYGAASRKIAAGAAPESVGRPGIGVPQPLGE